MALKVHFAILVSQVLGAGAAAVTQYVLSLGMNQLVYSFYCSLAALLLLAPTSFFQERKSPLQLSSCETATKLTFLGSLYFLTQALSTTGIKNTSANFFTGMQPSIPIFGTLFALLMRVDKFNWLKPEGQAKAAGILLCCSGAVVMVLWHGPCLLSGSEVAEVISQTSESFKQNWSLGVLCVLLYCMAMAISGCMIASILEKQPGTSISITTYTTAIGALLLGAVGVYRFRNLATWQLSWWDTRLLAVSFNGLLGTALAAVMVNWSIGKVGPILVACYLPVQPAASVLVSFVYLGTSIYLGSILGAFVVVVGLLLITWSREKATRELKQPLLV